MSLPTLWNKSIYLSVLENLLHEGVFSFMLKPNQVTTKHTIKNEIRRRHIKTNKNAVPLIKGGLNTWSLYVF